jgi:hypothetical protein
MEAAVHGLPNFYLVGLCIAMNLLEAECSVMFEALRSDLAFFDAYAAQSFDGVVP